MLPLSQIHHRSFQVPLRDTLSLQEPAQTNTREFDLEEILREPFPLQALQRNAYRLSETMIHSCFERLQNTLWRTPPPSPDIPLLQRGFVYKIRGEKHPLQRAPCGLPLRPPSFKCLALHNAFCPTGMYFSEGTIGDGSFKKIKKIAFVTPQSPTQKTLQYFALAKLLPRLRNHETSDTLQIEAEIPNKLLQRGVPFIIRSQVVEYSKKPGEHEERLLMEFCNKGNLQEYLQMECPLLIRMHLALQIAQAMAGMHRNGVFHFDIAARNIFVMQKHGEDPTIRIGDFGSAVMLPDPHAVVSNHIVTGYPPPEILQNSMTQQKTSIDSAADLWALGNILFLLKNQVAPLDCFQVFYSDGATYSENERKMRDWLDKELHLLPDPFNEVLWRLFSRNPSERPRADEVVHALEQWLRNYNESRTSYGS